MLFIPILGLTGFNGVASFYLPGVAPKNYKTGDIIPMFVNSLTAKDSLLPFDYYHPDFNFCKPSEPVSQRESLGSILFGDRLFTSNFQLKALQNQVCLPLCTSINSKHQNEFIINKIEEEYNFNWIVDGLPAAQVFFDPKTSDKFYSVGIPIGSKVGKKYYFNNHYSIHIHYHKRDLDTIRVVGVVVIPHSLSPESQKNNCAGVPNPELLIEAKSDNITYTYNVIWDEDEISWGTRWDHYLHVYDPQIHWFSIINSIVIVMILASMVAMILMRALHKDISRYNTLDEEDDGAQDDFGWKLVHADVFRAPRHRMLLSVLLGSGSQIICMLASTLVFAVLGFLSPSSRGSLGTISILFFTFFSAVAGYVSAIMYKTYLGEEKKKNIILTATLLPGLLFGIMFLLNFILISHESSAAVPFGTIFTLAAMWFLISIPLCVVGSYFGYKKEGFVPPVKTNQIPRQIPKQNYKWVWKSFFASAFAGVYIFLYSIVFYMRKLDMKDTASGFLYFGWSMVFSLMFSVFTGTVGYFGSFFFVRKIYKSIKID